MKAKLIAVFVLAMIVMAAQATIYSYKAKDGTTYYTNEVPTGLTTAEKKQFATVTAGTVDTLTKAAQLPLSNRDAVKATLRKDNAPPVVVVPTCVAPQVLNVATNKCENPPAPVCVAPQVLSTTTNKCETPVVIPPVTPPVVITPTFKLPGTAEHCAWENGKCTLPSGVSARVYLGAGGVYAYKDNVTGSIGCTKSAIGDPKNSYGNNNCYWVESKDFIKTLDPQGKNYMPYVNGALTPKGATGFSGPMIKAATAPPLQKFPYAGAFRIGCEYSHGNFDDPIVWPGLTGASHHHTFFGNTSINAYSTSEGILKEGNSTCAGGILNRSGYWMPSLINTANGAPQKPSVVVVYYKAIDEKSGMHIRPPPAGLRMIAGNARPLAVADVEGGFFCQDQTQVMNPANWGIIWQGNSIKQSCGGSNQMLRMIVTFPQCWDGKNLDSPDHKSHMAFACGDECLGADGKIFNSANSCPASHPVSIPNITINADFYGLDAKAKYRLSSDNYPDTLPGGYSLHADWMNGWDETIITRVVKNCLNNPRDCGGPNLGDGQTLYGVNQD